MHEKFGKIVEADMAAFKDYKVEPTEGFGAQELLQRLAGSTVEKELTAKRNFTKVIDSISFSAFNPVPPSRRLAGDIFYLAVKTLDAGEKYITCSSNGFYLNDSSHGHFSPGPSTTE